jgi:hypothetical protein
MGNKLKSNYDIAAIELVSVDEKLNGVCFWMLIKRNSSFLEFKQITNNFK